VIELDIEIEYLTTGISGVMKYNLNKKELKISNFNPGYFLSNDYYNGMNKHNSDVHSEILKNWIAELL